MNFLLLINAIRSVFRLLPDRGKYGQRIDLHDKRWQFLHERSQSVDDIDYPGWGVDDLDYISKSMDVIRKADPQFGAFGAERWRYHFRTVDETEITAIETAIGKPLPDEFKDFLLEIGFGPGPAYGANPGHFLAIKQYDPDPEAAATKGMYETGYIVVAEYGNGIESRLCLDDDHYGEIWHHNDLSRKVADDYISWYISWTERLRKILAEGNDIQRLSAML